MGPVTVRNATAFLHAVAAMTKGKVKAAKEGEKGARKLHRNRSKAGR